MAATGATAPLSSAMIEALRNLADGDDKHAAHVLPGRNPHSRNRPLSALKDRGLIKQIRQPYAWSSPKDVHWVITDDGRAALSKAGD